MILMKPFRRPGEWDLKRLVASFVIACRDNGLSESVAKDGRLHYPTPVRGTPP